MTGAASRSSAIRLRRRRAPSISAGGETVTVKDGRPDTRPLAMMQPQLYPGTPFVPTGNPMADGVGPAAWAERADKPDVTLHGAPRIVPLRIDGAFHIATDDPNRSG